MKESLFATIKASIPAQYKSKYKRPYTQLMRSLAEPLIQFRRFSLNFRELPTLVDPIFVVGTAKGGTTLLGQCMGQHPNVCHPTYAHFELSPEWCELAHIDISAPVTHRSNCPPLTEKDATEEICQNMRQGFARIMIEEGGSQKMRFLNKSPHLWNKLPFVQAIFADANLVIASRDIVSTVASLKESWARVTKFTQIKHYLPLDPEQCWSCIWPDSGEQLDPRRVFPGGDAAVLAEYWLRVYQTIEEHASQFKAVGVVKNREFTENPQLALRKVHQAINLPDVPYSLPTRLKQSRNQRWREILTAQEQESLKAFIEAHYQEITSLKYVDTTIAL